MKVVFPVLPKGVRGVACSLGLERRDRGKAVFIVRDDLLGRVLVRGSALQDLSSQCAAWWVRLFGKPLVDGLALISESESFGELAEWSNC
jgi:hypothetical protein